MSVAPNPNPPPEAPGRPRTPPVARQPQPVTPGKVAMWLFLATEVMFFTGLIGSYIVLRAGSPEGGYSALYPPGTPLAGLEGKRGVVVRSISTGRAEVARAVAGATGMDPARAEHALEWLPHVVANGLAQRDADVLRGKLQDAGATADVLALDGHTARWPRPYDATTNPLSIDLTAANTFILICSSVTMVLALSAIQRGHRWRLVRYLGLTILLGGTFLGIQVYEYRQLLFGHVYPPGISATGHFTPDVSLFASCFFTMTGFHGAHVAGGLVALSLLFLRALFGGYTRGHHGPVELVGLYWHFVDLVWILLFTVVYLI
jgi:heme/copper-type cytochrome/quinol oxidase subunit 3